MSFDQDRNYNHENRQSLPRPIDTTMGSGLRGPATSGSGIDEDLQRRLDAALHSPYGIDKLQHRLKQSIYSARDYSGFMKERCALEERYAQGYKKLVRHAFESIRKPEARQGSYARNFDESLRVNDRLAENGQQFANSLQTMSDELRDMAENAEKGRKHWKHTALDAEKRVADAEGAQMKAKERFNTAAEQYERVRVGEKQGGKFGLKNKSPAQQEEALKEKADMLDQDYTSKTHAAQEQRREFESTTRPQIVRALTDLIHECDAAVAMQMAKLASISEKHVVSNGMAIAPIRSADSGHEPRGLRHIVADVDDKKDFSDYMLDGVEPPSQFKGRSRRNTEAELVNTPNRPDQMQPSQSFGRSQTFESPYNSGQGHVANSTPPQLPQIGAGDDAFSKSFEMQRPGVQNNQSSYMSGQPDTLNSTPTTQSTLHSAPSYRSQQTGITGTHNPAPSPGNGKGTLIGPSLPPYDRAQAPPSAAYNGRTSLDLQGPPRQNTIGPTPFDQNQSPPRQGQSPPRQDTVRPAMPGTFDSSLGFLRQDQVQQATGRGQPPSNNIPSQFLGRGGPAPGSYMDPGKSATPYGPAAVAATGRGQPPSAARALPSQQPQRPTLPPNKPVFGVTLDELFRRDGSAVPAIVFQCIQAVDSFGLHTEGIYRVPGSSPTVMQLKSEFDHDSSTVKLNSRESFNNDIAAVATLLKNFLRELPDSLLTNTAYPGFIQAAKYEDSILRRDALHQYINSLPDPNYATLRVLVLHMHRIAMNAEVNKMDIRNLSILLGPTVMGGGNLNEANLQAEVMETILHHTHDIFDPDE